jgi:hypothetical protein
VVAILVRRVEKACKSILVCAIETTSITCEVGIVSAMSLAIKSIDPLFVLRKVSRELEALGARSRS